MRKRLSTRYNITDKYEGLCERNIFCSCANQEIALEVKRMTQEITSQKEKLIKGSTCGEETLGDDEDDYLVYVTTLKLELLKCPLESCGRVRTKEGIDSHMLNNEFIVKTITLNDMLKQVGISPMSARISPIPVGYLKLIFIRIVYLFINIFSGNMRIVSTQFATIAEKSSKPVQQCLDIANIIAPKISTAVEISNAINVNDTFKAFPWPFILQIFMD